ncbi:MAG: polysaccharide deacetylase family protein, partial [Eubacteriales bacterium]|nr:polysaccharide deacetylase family protein [Eubacteriales bacterium]
MSNKPFRLRPQGALLQEPEKVETNKPRPRRAGWKSVHFPHLRKSSAAQAGWLLTLALLSALYLAPLNNPATAVVARRRELPVYSVARDDQKIAVSFDASWGADKTFDILDILDQRDIKTTFFLVGGWVTKYPDMVKEIARRGHEIGNHSDTHPHMSTLSEAQIRKELSDMSDRVEALIGTRPTLFRPPYGDYNDRVVSTSRAEGYEAVQWSIDSLDWKDRGTADIIKQCTYRVESGDIVLFHNDSNDIVNALPTVLDHYQNLGFSIVPVSELL